jgi:hypothetical protein
LARFYIDHDVSSHTVLALGRQGHDVLTTRELHRERAPDYRQLLVAAERNRILVTHNEKDYSLLNGAWVLWSSAWQVEARHHGVLIIPQWVPLLPEWGPEGAALRLTDFVETHPSLENELYVWRRDTGWRQVHA